MLSVLHVWNTAGVASTLAKWQAKLLGWRAWVITRAEADPYQHTVYGSRSYLPPALFAAKALHAARLFDLVHVHSWDKLLVGIRKLYKRKPVVLHYHGSDIRGRWAERRRFWKLADAIIVSTPDLLRGAPEIAEHVPNPVDTDLFKPRFSVALAGSAIFFYDPRSEKLRSSLAWARRIAEEKNLRLLVYDRSKARIPYYAMPTLLSRFEFFIDHSYVPALSRTALEALACGLKVVRWDGRIVNSLPEEYRPENVMRKIVAVYLRAVRSRLAAKA